ncbi:MAG: class I fructose-bisphosphate aldolase [Thermoplasmata archaeon]
MTGRELRLRRLFPPGGARLFAVPLDHSVSLGPIEGLEEMGALTRELVLGGVDLLIVPKGAVGRVGPNLGPHTRIAVHLSASTALGPDPDRKVLVGTAAEAASLGGDLVSMQVNFGGPGEPAMLEALGRMADECRAVGLPLLCMAYVKGPRAPRPEEIQHAARAAADLGADIIKTSWPGSREEFRRLLATTPVPTLVSGGERKGSAAEILTLVRDVLEEGGAGICIGRNLFQQSPRLPFVREIAALVHGAGEAPGR